MTQIVYRPHRHSEHMEETPDYSNTGAIGICECGRYVRCGPLMAGAVFLKYCWFEMSDRQIRKARRIGEIPGGAA